MHAPGFRRKPLADILGMRHHMACKLQPQGFKSVPVALCLRRLSVAAVCVVAWLATRHGGLARTPQIQPGHTQRLAHFTAAAHRALHQMPAALSDEILLRGEPSLEGMIERAKQIENFHWVALALPVQRRPDGRAYDASVRTMASAHNAISPPGRTPTRNTRAPLSVSTTRTSAGAETVVAVIGWSKYMTLTTRR